MRSQGKQRAKLSGTLTLKASEALRLQKIKVAKARREAIREAADQMAVIIKDFILLRTRFDESGLNGKLASLGEKTIAARRRSKKLSVDTTPETSNLTGTGQMLDALASKRNGSKITVEVKNTKRRKELAGKSRLTNKEVQRFVEKAGREFLGLTAKERKEATDLATKIIADFMKNALN